jgi:D-alanyl-D-alanine dipeptidase
MRRFDVCLFVIAVARAALESAAAQATIPLVNIKSVDPTIVIELRYASPNNFTGQALYLPGTPALVHPEVAQRLAAAQTFLKHHKYGLKIWDAYRPRSVQAQLWKAAHNNDYYVADPATGAGSLHTWGIAVDATLVDIRNRPVTMPTDYDNFTSAAMWIYRGTDFAVWSHLHLLQRAMGHAGFDGLRTEWWHFTITNWQRYLPEEVKHAAQAFESQSKEEL